MSQRFAIYYAPARDSEIDRLAWAWFNRPELQPLTVSARRYGFHATLKAPMALKAGRTEDELAAALKTFCRANSAVSAGRTEPRIIDGFLALVPVAQPRELTDFAAHVVEYFDRFRAPPDPAVRQRRLAAPLSDRQIALFERYGYPYVFEQFQFHMTLTDRLTPGKQAGLLAEARAAFAPGLATPLELDRLVLFREPSAGGGFVRGAEFVLEGARR